MMDVYENTSEYVVKNKRQFRNSSKSLNDTNNEEKAADSGRRVIKLVFVSFGLLCILQATLNIGLRLSLYFDSKCENETAERDELQETYSLLKTSYQNLSDEREKLEENYSNSYLKQDWVYFSGSLYHGSTQKKSWNSSGHYCQAKGADLIIIINSREEQGFASIFTGRRWIGLTYLESEGVWKWVDGSPFNTSYWRSGEPNDYNRGEACAACEDNIWNDLSCASGLFTICEKIITF